jgi:imidazolonepropionase-like amidohydrolase
MPTATAQPTVTLSPLPSPTALPRYDLVLVGALLIDGSGLPAQPDTTVALRDGRIAAIGSADELPFSSDTPVRDLGGAALLPGITNTHAHTEAISEPELSMWARAGVTTLRDLGGSRRAMFARRAALAAANRPDMPRLLAAGPIVTVPGGHPIPVDGLDESVLAVRGPDDARAQIQALLDDGADVIKIAVSGRTDTNWPELSDAEIRAITDTAHARGVRVTAHVDRTSALMRAVENGIDDAANMPRSVISDEQIARMVERGVGLTPTIQVYEALAEQRGNLAEWRRVIMPVMYDNLRRFVAAGGLLALGDDYGNPGVALGMPLPEIRHWLAAGLTPAQIIVAATQGGAAVCGLSDQLGQVRPGFVADLLAVDGDPQSDIEALARPVLVVRMGRVIAG